MRYTTQHQSQLFLGMGLDRNTADLIYPSNPNNRHNPLYDVPSLRYGMPMDEDDLPCWSYEQLYNVLGMYKIHFSTTIDNVHISNDDKAPVVRDLEVFKFNQDEDYIFRKHFNDIISAVEWCLQEGYMRDPINCETPAGAPEFWKHLWIKRSDGSTEPFKLNSAQIEFLKILWNAERSGIKIVYIPSRYRCVKFLTDSMKILKDIWDNPTKTNNA